MSPDPRDFLPQPPWKGPPVPRGLTARRAPVELRPPGWQPRKPYLEELGYELTPGQERYLVASLAEVIYKKGPLTPEQLEWHAIRYAEADLWVLIGKEKAREIREKALRYWD